MAVRTVVLARKKPSFSGIASPLSVKANNENGFTSAFPVIEAKAVGNEGGLANARCLSDIDALAKEIAAGAPPLSAERKHCLTVLLGS